MTTPTTSAPGSAAQIPAVRAGTDTQGRVLYVLPAGHTFHCPDGFIAEEQGDMVAVEPLKARFDREVAAGIIRPLYWVK